MCSQIEKLKDIQDKGIDAWNNADRFHRVVYNAYEDIAELSNTIKEARKRIPALEALVYDISYDEAHLINEINDTTGALHIPELQ